MYVVTKTINGRKYDSLYACVWADGKPKTRFIRYLGRHAVHTRKELDAIIKAEVKKQDG